jgi:hypothetical protein
MDDAEKRRMASRQVHAMEGFYVHAAIYVIVNLILLVVNLAISDIWWVQWPALGWGLGVIGHGLLVFGRTPERLQAWRERKIRQIMEKS